jgi:hypothetical protein
MGIKSEMTIYVSNTISKSVLDRKKRFQGLVQNPSLENTSLGFLGKDER